MIDRERLDAAMALYDIPEYMRDGIRVYVFNHQEPGSFLRAVLENSFIDAFAYADNNNLERMHSYAQLLYSKFPSRSLGILWGSSEIVAAWIKMGVTSNPQKVEH